MSGPRAQFDALMPLYAVRSALLDSDPLGDCVDLFLRREDAERFLSECLADEPGWRSVLIVEDVEYETGFCPN